MMHTYEQIALLIENLPLPSAAHELEVEWLSQNRVAIGKDVRGRHALLISGVPIVPSVDLVLSALKHGAWQTPKGETVHGNLLLLPGGAAFATATAAIAAELFRLGIESRAENEVFQDVEPFIALVLRRVLLPEEYLLGLIGELLILKQVVEVVTNSKVRFSDPTAMWRGWQRQSRDLVLGRAAIEVKTTSHDVSRHIVGVDQIEPRALDGGDTEDLYLASVGLRPGQSSAGLSISGLTEAILTLLRSEPDLGLAREHESIFLGRLAQYGPEGFGGYRHDEMQDHEAYSKPYTTTFVPRVYNLGDKNIRIIRRKDLAENFQFVRPDGLTYTVELPDSIPGSIENPRMDLRACIAAILAKSA